MAELEYYYCKEDGLAVGDAGRTTVKRTGLWTSDTSLYYSSVGNAISASTTKPGTGANFYGSHLSVGDVYTASTTITAGTSLADAADPQRIISVDNASQDQFKPGWREGFTITNADFIVTGHWVACGYKIDPGDDFFISSANSSWVMQNGEIDFPNGGSTISLVADGVNMILNDVIINMDVAGTAFIGMSNGAYLKMTGGGFTNLVLSLLNGGSGDGGLSAYFRDVDMSGLTNNLLAGIGGQVADDAFIMVVEGCKLNALVTFATEKFKRPNQEMWVINSGPTGTEVEQQFFYRNWRGDVENEGVIIRPDSAIFPGANQRISLKVTPEPSASRLTPFIFEIPAAFVKLSAATTDVLQLFFTCGIELTNADIWVEAFYSTQADKSIYQPISNGIQEASSYTIDPLADGVVHASNASWDNPLAFQQTMSIDTSAVQGADSVPHVRIHVATTALLYIDCVYFIVGS